MRRICPAISNMWLICALSSDVSDSKFFIVFAPVVFCEILSWIDYIFVDKKRIRCDFFVTNYVTTPVRAE